MNRAQRRAAGLPSAREMDRLSCRVETTGCDRCRAVIGELMPYFFSRVQSGKFEVRCPNCRTVGGAKPVLGGVCVGGGTDPWSRDDRDWFAAHPKRQWRLREPGKGEIDAMKAVGTGWGPLEDRLRWLAEAEQSGRRLAVAVRQIKPGARVRLLATLPADAPLDSFTEAGIAKLTPGSAEAARMTLQDAEQEKLETVRNRVTEMMRGVGIGAPPQPR